MNIPEIKKCGLYVRQNASPYLRVTVGTGGSCIVFPDKSTPDDAKGKGVNGEMHKHLCNKFWRYIGAA